MTFTFRPAAREDVKLMIGLGGPSGSGKTYSALRLAKGLAAGKPIFGIDTEARRMLHYADDFQFQHAELAAPFAPERYEEAIRAAVIAGAAVVIVDSMSHEHEGPGGILEMHDQELVRMAGEDFGKRERVRFAAWIKPKMQHNRFLNAILQVPVHLIFCFRAKDKLMLVKNAQGKQEPVSIGFQPICSDRFEYEMTMMLMLPPASNGVPALTASATKLQQQHRSIVIADAPLDEGTGARLAQWASGAVDWAKWGSEAAMWVSDQYDSRVLDKFTSTRADKLAGYKAWNEEKYAALMAHVAERKTALLNKGA